MPVPKFRLQSVLAYREQILDLRRQEMGDLERALARERQALEELQARRCHLEAKIRVAQEGRLDCEHVRRLLAYLERLRQHEQEQEARVAEAEAQREAKRTEVVRALQDKQVIEKLRERHIALQRKEELQREGKMLDEISVTRFHDRVRDLEE
jgi:flagellar protein FliJ